MVHPVLVVSRSHSIHSPFSGIIRRSLVTKPHAWAASNVCKGVRRDTASWTAKRFNGTTSKAVAGQQAPLDAETLDSLRREARLPSKSIERAEDGTDVETPRSIVLFRGPPAMKTWIYYLVGGMFVLIGFESAHNLYHHLSWPLVWRDPDNSPKLVTKWKRQAVAFFVGIAGIFVGALFVMVPSATITRLTLELPARKLIIRTSVRGMSALLPRAILPRPFRTLAERHGFYQTTRNNERTVPLSTVFRMRGSATSEHDSKSNGSVASVTIRPSHARNFGGSRAGRRQSENAAAAGQRQTGNGHSRHIEMKVAGSRLWYALEAEGGKAPENDPSLKTGYARFWRRISYWMRGYTDWGPQSPSHEAEVDSVERDSQDVGEKEPWFSDRRTFDDVFPLIRRR